MVRKFQGSSFYTTKVMGYFIFKKAEKKPQYRRKVDIVIQIAGVEKYFSVLWEVITWIVKRKVIYALLKFSVINFGLIRIYFSNLKSLQISRLIHPNFLPRVSNKISREPLHSSGKNKVTIRSMIKCYFIHKPFIRPKHRNLISSWFSVLSRLGRKISPNQAKPIC